MLILVDRTDLDTQITGTFNAADVANVVTTDSIKELHDLLEKGTRKIIITTIHKFRDAYPDMNTRDNIIVMVDEAHRTQEGNLGRQMRAALPNAFLFGLTGTPVNKADKSTFWAFGSEEDDGGYLSRYSFQDSIRDRATLPLHFEPRLVDIHVDSDSIDEAFKQLTESASLSDEEADALNAYQTDYRWLTGVYQSVKPSSDNIGKFLWHSLGAKTSALIHQHIHVAGIVKEILQTLSAKLISEFGQGFSHRNLRYMVAFASTFPESEIVAALSRRLGTRDALLASIAPRFRHSGSQARRFGYRRLR